MDWVYVVISAGTVGLMLEVLTRYRLKCTKMSSARAQITHSLETHNAALAETTRRVDKARARIEELSEEKVRLDDEVRETLASSPGLDLDGEATSGSTPDTESGQRGCL